MNCCVPTVRFVVNVNDLRALDKLNSDYFDPRFITEGNLIPLRNSWWI